MADEEWAVLEPLLPKGDDRCGRRRGHRQVVDGIIHRLGAGARWCEPPERCGPWKTVPKRRLLRSADDTWGMLLQRIRALAGAAGGIDRNADAGSAAVRARRSREEPAARTARRFEGGPRGKSVHVQVNVNLRLLREMRHGGREPQPFPWQADLRTAPWRGRRVPPTAARRHAGAGGGLRSVPAAGRRPAAVGSRRTDGETCRLVPRRSPPSGETRRLVGLVNSVHVPEPPRTPRLHPPQ
ncbi:transposase [Streptomyces prasinus]|uniref:transposase n=1 Tax=Streptomyces prasinus TaxID=67345 RepID=UPI00331B0F2B